MYRNNNQRKNAQATIPSFNYPNYQTDMPSDDKPLNCKWGLHPVLNSGDNWELGKKSMEINSIMYVQWFINTFFNINGSNSKYPIDFNPWTSNLKELFVFRDSHKPEFKHIMENNKVSSLRELKICMSRTNENNEFLLNAMLLLFGETFLDDNSKEFEHNRNIEKSFSNWTKIISLFRESNYENIKSFLIDNPNLIENLLINTNWHDDKNDKIQFVREFITESIVSMVNESKFNLSEDCYVQKILGIRIIPDKFPSIRFWLLNFKTSEVILLLHNLSKSWDSFRYSTKMDFYVDDLIKKYGSK